MKKIFANKKFKKGFTFVEVIVTMFVFVAVMAAVAGIFSSLTKSNRKAVLTQRDLEQAQHALNLMAKTIRTSSIVTSCATPPCTVTSLVVFDNSRSNGQCINYALDAGNHVTNAGAVDSATKVTCASASITPMIEMMGIYVDNLGFEIIPSTFDVNDGILSTGKVTIAMKVCPTSACADKALIQTTVSLRNYKEVAP